VGLLRKSKPHPIKAGALLTTLGLLSLALTGLAGAKGPPPKLVRISVDTTSTAGAQHATEVEPDAVAAGSRIVSTFQVGRYFGGGAAAIGFSTSTNAGRTWRSGLLPLGVTFASDPVVARDDLHSRWLISTLSKVGDQSVVFVSGSADGLAWDPPATAISYPVSTAGEDAGTAIDKQWIACDNGAASPFRGHCYLGYTDIAHDTNPNRPGGHIAIQSSSDGGMSWSTPVLLPVNATIVSPGVQPVVRPNGELVVVFFEDGLAEAVRSNDGAATFSDRERISSVAFHRRPITPTRFRTFTLPTATVDAAGAVYVAWFDCRFRSPCRADDIVWSRSTTPGTWTPVRRVPLAPPASRLEFVLPDLAVSGKRLALTYYALSSPDCTEANCLLDVYLVTSKTSGMRWTKPRRLNPRRMRLTWLPQTVSGRMVGDYTATVFSGNRIVSIHVQARGPRGGRFNEAVYAYGTAVP
jgi:hypothetical protein